MAPANDNGIGGESRVPSVTPTPSLTGEAAAASEEAQRRLARMAAEERVLREGEAARFDLARQLAREAITDPEALDPKRLSRLGASGLARFATELREAALGSAKPLARPAERPGPPASSAPVPALAARGVPVASAAQVGSCAAHVGGPVAGRGEGKTRTGSFVPPPSRKTPVQTRRPAPSPPRTAAFVGWWKSQRDGHALFEARARRWGVLAGMLLIAACLTFLATTQS